MHILESYALQNDLKIDRASRYEKFFPLAVEKYITIDTSSLSTSAMHYDHWQLVVDIIKPFLDNKGIQIVQLGEKDCTPIKGCYMAIGQCNFNQKSYVIKNSLVHLSSNNESSHISSKFDKKSVILFPYNCYVSQFKPYWSSPENLEILQGESPTERPSFNPSESPKSINTIEPEAIATKALRFLGIDTFTPEYKTLRIGASFYRPRIESNLSHLLDAQKLGMSSLIMRMDLNFNEEMSDAQSGTAFWRSKEFQEEFVSSDKNYRGSRILNKINAYVNFDPSQYKSKDWERYHVEPHEFNTLLLYEGRLWHSPYFRQEGWGTNRLTFNAFLH